MTLLFEIAGYGVCLFLGLLCVILLKLIWQNKIDLSMLLSDPNGAASVSRLQLLIFTLVVAISLFILVEKNGTFPPISDGILTLLGISASTYAVSKGISFSRDEGVTTREERAAKAQAASDAAVALVQATTPIPAPAQPNVAVAGAGGVVVQQQADQGQAQDE